MRRPLVLAVRIVAVLGSVLLLVAALTTDRNPRSPFAYRSFSGRGLSFEYPAAWSARTFSASGSFSSGLARISSQGFTVPCQSDACYRPAGGTLAPGSVFGMWWNQASIHGPRDFPGEPITVGGQPAHLDRHPPDAWCEEMGGTESFDVYMASSPQRLWTQLAACLRAPTERAETELHRLLETVRLDFASA